MAKVITRSVSALGLAAALAGVLAMQSAQPAHAAVLAPAAPQIRTLAAVTTVATASTTAQVTTGQPCRVGVRWPSSIGQWTVPLDCYSHIYYPSPASYVSRPSYGYCNWWPEVLHPWESGYTALHRPGHSTPTPGAVVWFAPGVQGAGGDGHYAQVVAISPGGHWLLITEMNFYWRGAGFKRVDYRFIHVGSGVSFRY